MAGKQKRPTKREQHDAEVMKEARFFMAGASEAEARADDARRKRERAGHRLPNSPHEPGRNKGGEHHATFVRSHSGMTHQCQDCNAITYPTGKRNPGHQLAQSEAFFGTKGVSHGLCTKCDTARRRFSRQYARTTDPQERRKLLRAEDERLAGLNPTYRDDPNSARNKRR